MHPLSLWFKIIFRTYYILIHRSCREVESKKKDIVSKLEKMPLEPSSIVNVFNVLYIRDEFGKVLIDSVLSYPFRTI